MLVFCGFQISPLRSVTSHLMRNKIKNEEDTGVDMQHSCCVEDSILLPPSCYRE
jgi:hypothetical protein